MISCGLQSRAAYIFYFFCFIERYRHRRMRQGGWGLPLPHDLKYFRASASCSKILNVKCIFNTVKNFWANSVFEGKVKLLKNPEPWKNVQYTVYIRLGVICVVWANCYFQGKYFLLPRQNAFPHAYGYGWRSVFTWLRFVDQILLAHSILFSITCTSVTGGIMINRRQL